MISSLNRGFYYDSVGKMKRLYPIKKNGRFDVPGHESGGWIIATIAVLFKALYHDYIYPVTQEAKKWVAKKRSFLPNSYEPHFTWLGHSTFLIQVGDKNILTDPIFGNLSGIFSRIIPYKVTAKNLPKIDFIILSHNHPDHMDSFSLRQIQQCNPAVKVLVPMGDKSWFDEQGFLDCSEHMWWDEIICDDVKFTFLPAKHWSQRGLFDKNKSLWGSWMIDHKGFKFYFAGDTGWDLHFSMIGRIFKKIDVALMPIGPGTPRKWMHHAHINAEEAGKAFLELKARWFVPMHWGTFHLGLDTFKEPIVRIRSWWQLHKKQCADKSLKVPKVGQLVACVRENMRNNIAVLSRLKPKSRSKVL